MMSVSKGSIYIILDNCHGRLIVDPTDQLLQDESEKIKMTTAGATSIFRLYACEFFSRKYPSSILTTSLRISTLTEAIEEWMRFLFRGAKETDSE